MNKEPKGEKEIYEDLVCSAIETGIFVVKKAVKEALRLKPNLKLKHFEPALDKLVEESKKVKTT